MEEQPGRYKRLAKNTVLMFIGTFGSKLVSFVMLPFYTMWLSVEDYGTSDIINVYSTVLLTLVSLCIGEAIFVIPSQKSKEQQSSYFTSSIVFSFLCAGVLALLFFLVRIFMSDTHNSFCDNIGYITLLTLTTLYTTVFQQFCKSIDEIRIFAFTGILQTLIVAGLGFCVIPKYQLAGYLWCMIIANIAAGIFVFFAAKLHRYLNTSLFSRKALGEMFRYSIPLIPNSVIWLVVSYLNRPLMESYLGLYAIGIYALANKFPTLINTVYNNFSSSWQISVLEQYGKSGFNSFYNKVMLMIIGGLSLFVACFSLGSSPLIKTFFSENYIDAIKYIPLLSLSCVFIAIGSISGAVFSAVRLSKYFFYSSIWSAASAIILNYILIRRFGIDGACWACVLSYLVGGVSRILYAKKFVTFNVTGYLSILTAILCAVVCSIVYLDSTMMGAVLTIVLLSVYVMFCKKESITLASIKKRNHANKENNNDTVDNH